MGPGLDADDFEGNGGVVDEAFAAFTDRLDAFERIRMKLVTSLRPAIILRGCHAETPYELCPNGFKAMWEGEVLGWLGKADGEEQALPRAPLLMDLGCGIGGVCLMAALLVGAEAHGIEYNEELHSAALSWHRRVGEHDPPLRAAMAEQQSRIILGDLRCPSAAVNSLMEDMDVIFCNNYEFGANLNDRLYHWMCALNLKKDVCIVTSCALTAATRPGMGLRYVKKFELPPKSVSWAEVPVTFYLTTKG